METIAKEKPEAKPKVRLSLPLPTDGYQQLPYVNYWRLEPKTKPVRINKQCFGSMVEAGVPSAIRYIAPITKVMKNGKNVAEGAVDFYLKFMLRILRQPESPKFTVRRIGEDVYYRIESKGLFFRRVLFYLTWFRYVHHYPEMIHELFTRAKPGDDDEALFRIFQEAHWDMCKGTIEVLSRTYSDESLIYRYWGQDNGNPTPLATLINNIKLGKTESIRVQHYFI